MDMEYITLKQISRDKNNSKVKVRVLRMWDAINIANNHDLISLDMVLVDEERTLIHASIRKNLTQNYRPQLNEGSIYTISNFLVEENKGNYRPVHNKLKILFNSTTSVSKFSGIDHSIPQSQFEFVDYGTIASRCYDTTYLTDVIGILDYIGAIEEIKTRGRPTRMRNIQLLLEEYSTMDINVKEILPKALPKVQDGELALHNKKTVAEIKTLEWNSEIKDLLVTCNAKIININNKYGWYYVACLICKTKVKQVKGVLWCERCKNEPKFAVPSYRIQVQVQDETDTTTFILFDKAAEKIISKTARELAEMQEEVVESSLFGGGVRSVWVCGYGFCSGGDAGVVGFLVVVVAAVLWIAKITEEGVTIFSAILTKDLLGLQPSILKLLEHLPKIDHSIVESFGGKGKAGITARVYPTLATDAEAYLYAFNNGTGNVGISTLSAWNVQPTVHVTCGPCKYLDIWDLPDKEEIELELNSEHQLVDDGARTFTGFLGTIARKPHMCPIRYLNWKDMPEENKEECWRVVERKYYVPINPIAYAALKRFTLQKIGKAWRDHKSRMKKQHYILDSRNKARVKNNGPRGCISQDWDILVDHWYTDDAVAKTDGRPVERSVLYKILHARKDGSAVNPVMKAKMSSDTSGSIAWSTDNVFAKVMGKERKGHIRGVGFGPSPSGRSSKSVLTDIEIHSSQAKDNKVAQLKDSLPTMEDKLANFDEMKEKLSQFEEIEQRMARMLQQMQQISSNAIRSSTMADLDLGGRNWSSWWWIWVPEG
ncbi:hypothetical protein SO802_011057 [Lithocarpus litseifolius]|uniref:Replication factor A C-terminal domain-containing protein n=1 Tax=Lithocarpus litseifolius TaxID=425828 RepID=A0AAW2DFX9_9ROSI